MKVWSCGEEHGTYIINPKLWGVDEITTICPCGKPAIEYKEYIKVAMRLTPEREKEIRKWTAKDYDQCLFCVELLAEIDALRADLIVEESLKVMAQKNLAQLKAENERLKEPIVAITDGPIVNENITIDTRYKFECEIKRLKARIEKLR